MLLWRQLAQTWPSEYKKCLDMAWRCVNILCRCNNQSRVIPLFSAPSSLWQMSYYWCGDDDWYFFFMLSFKAHTKNYFKKKLMSCNLIRFNWVELNVEKLWSHPFKECVSMRSTFLILKSENWLKELIHYKQIYLLFLNEGNDLGFTSVTSY